MMEMSLSSQHLMGIENQGAANDWQAQVAMVHTKWTSSFQAGSWHEGTNQQWYKQDGNWKEKQEHYKISCKYYNRIYGLNLYFLNSQRNQIV